MNNIEEEFEKILEITNKQDEEILGGLVYLDNLTIDQLKEIQNNTTHFYDPNESQNDAPTNKMLADFCENHSDFVMEAYVISPEREDYRLNIVAIKAPSNSINTHDLYEFINNLDSNQFDEPDEYGTYNGNIRAWWD